MTKRENLLWQIILVIASFVIIYNAFFTYELYNESILLWENYNNEEIGTDRILQEKVQKLEASLQNKKDFIFKMKKNPSDLSSVIDFEGIDAIGNRHFKLESIYYANREKQFKAFITAQVSGKSRTYKVTKNDSVASGIILDIDEDGVVFEKDNEIFNYKLGENNDQE
tara:strand:- start:7 stop:510 length:504 start_codon:yes stop_codon:yes gene_type:complete